jgi:hypothetical protein
MGSILLPLDPSLDLGITISSSVLLFVYKYTSFKYFKLQYLEKCLSSLYGTLLSAGFYEEGNYILGEEHAMATILPSIF